MLRSETLRNRGDAPTRPPARRVKGRRKAGRGDRLYSSNSEKLLGLWDGNLWVITVQLILGEYDLFGEEKGCAISAFPRADPWFGACLRR
jgi:hypothetical protein